MRYLFLGLLLFSLMGIADDEDGVLYDEVVNVGSNESAGKADQDGDGVVDRLDRCPATPAGIQVSRYGCAKDEKVEISLYIDFITGTSAVDPEFHESLAGVADFLSAYPETDVVLEGYTDNVGSVKGNMVIAEKRATSVKNYLVKRFNINPKRITVKAFGPENPIASNKTEKGRRKNRRVVASISAKSE